MRTNLVEEISSQIAISIEKEFIQAELRKSEQSFISSTPAPCDVKPEYQRGI